MARRRRRPALTAGIALVLLVLLVGVSFLQLNSYGAVQGKGSSWASQQKISLPVSSKGKPLAYSCTNNSVDPRCCSAEHCRLVVRRSTLFSECCGNLPFFNGTMADQAKAEIKTGFLLSNLTRNIPVLITATPRSGTVFLQTLLQKLNVRTVNDMRSPTPITTKAMVSWIHIQKDKEYFGNARIYGSTFQHLWHFVRDPLKCITSIAFTEPLDDTPYNSEGPSSYLAYLRRHIYLTDRKTIENLIQQKHQQQRNPILLSSGDHGNRTEPPPRRDEPDIHSKFLIYRGLEFYIQWHTFILQLQIPRIALEDLTVHGAFDHGLHDIFRALEMPLPSHDRVVKLISTLRRRRHLTQESQKKQKQHTNSRHHRSILQWEELCATSVSLTRDFLSLCHDLGYYENMTSVCDG